MSKKWPKHSQPANIEDLIRPLRMATDEGNVRQVRIPKGDISWRGVPFGKHSRHIMPEPGELLTKRSLRYNRQEQNRDFLDTILMIAINLGIEQGRRATCEKLKLLKTILSISVMSGSWEGVKDVIKSLEDEIR